MQKGSDRLSKWSDLLFQKVDPLPLSLFRITFGILLFISQVRFLAEGWVETLYLEPTYHFTYPGFHWVRPLPGIWMYSLVIGTAALAVFIALGLFYRIAIIGFFLSFTYLELIDKSWYLNHYYFVSLIAFLLVFLPANQSMSIDSLRLKHSDNRIPRWSILCIQCQVATVYFFAGIAKIKYDWLILAQPMDIWLNARTHIPVIGSLFSFDVTPYIFSWA